MIKISESLIGFDEKQPVSPEKISDAAERILQEYRDSLLQLDRASREPSKSGELP
jgi:hypothetical protein